MRYYRQHKEQINKAKRARDTQVRSMTLEAYGGACVCCGESTPEFLTIDHIDGTGAAHRKTLSGKRQTGGGVRFYRWLKAKGFPKDNYQLLCWNCNVSKGLYGACPHRRPLDYETADAMQRAINAARTELDALALDRAADEACALAA